MAKEIKYINKDITSIKGLEFSDVRSSNGYCCPLLTADNVKAVNEHVISQSLFFSGAVERLIGKYFKEHCGDVSPQTVCKKVIMIDAVASTKLDQKLGKGWFEIAAKRIIDLDLESVIKNGNRLGGLFKALADIPTVTDSDGTKEELFAFFSQYIAKVNRYSYNRRDYCIADTVITKNLRHFSSDLTDIERLILSFRYDEYCDAFKAFVKSLPNVTEEMICNFILFTFSEGSDI